jgi:chaperonin GroES
MTKGADLLEFQLGAWPLDGEQRLFVAQSLEGAGDEECVALAKQLEIAAAKVESCAIVLGGETPANQQRERPQKAQRRAEQNARPSLFRPLHDHILVRPLRQEEKTRGGIIIPDTAQDKPQEGEVVAVGPGARDEDGERIAMEVAVGDRILFGKWTGTEVRINGEDLLIMKEGAIMGVIEEEETQYAKIVA